MRSTLLKTIALGLLLAASARAGTTFINFDTDPTGTGLYQDIGSGQWRGTGGNPATGGYLSVTDALNGQSATLIFKDFDTNLIVKAFSFSMDVRIGNGTASPADGFSVNYARAGDPVLVNADGSGFACSPTGECGLPEEGTTTGMAIGFDSWFSGGADVIGISVRVDNVIITNIAYPTLNGACNDLTSLQTGPMDGTGSPDVLCWQPFTVNVDEDGTVDITYKGAVVVTNFPTAYFPSAGRLVFAGRTGGANQNHHVDNINITTIAADTVVIGNAVGNPLGFRVTVADSGPAVSDTNTLVLKFNDAAVTPTQLTKNGGVVTIVYQQSVSSPLLIGSTNKVSLSIKDTRAIPTSADRFFVVAPYSIIPAAYSVTGVDTSKPGFLMGPYQTAAANPNTLAWTEEQLNGLHGPNIADLTGATFGVPGIATTGFYQRDTVINFDVGTGAGNFTAANGYADDTFPGIPGPTVPGTDLTANSTEEVFTWLLFPAAGVYTMGVNSDDGFKVTTGYNPKDGFAALNLGQFDAGRGASDTLFTFIVNQAGYYSFRLLWENGTGGANCEWFTVNSDGVTKTLINDTTSANAILAYRGGPALPAFVSSVVPSPNATGVRPDIPAVSAQLTDGSTQVNAASVKLSFNGSAPVSGTKSGGLTTATIPLTGLLPSGSTNTATVVWSDNGSPAVTATNTWSFVVMAYTRTLPTDLVSPLGSGDATKPGFNVTANQVDNTAPNNDTDNNNVATESQLAGLYGPNIADLTGAVGGIFSVTNYINWDREANDGTAAPFGQGNFTEANGYPENPLPGITGPAAAAAPFEAVAEGVQTYIEFPSAGFYQMGVNSDDNFRLTVADAPPGPALQISGPTNTALPSLSMSLLPGEEVGGRAVYGAPPPVPPLTAPIVYMTPGGINDPGPYPDVTGKIALLDRSGSSLGTTSTGGKCKAAQVAGAAGVVFTTPGDGSYGFYAGATRTDITIPVLTVPDSTSANLLRSYLTNGISVTATISGDANFLVGGFNDGRGATDTLMNFVVAQAGVYPMRLIFHQGGGGANCEWFSVKPDGKKVLVGDTAAGGLKAYRARTFVPAPRFNPTTISSGSVTISWTGTGILQQATTLTGNASVDFSDVAGNPSSPFPVTPGTTAQKFYRLR